MHTKLPSALALTLASLPACDPGPDAGEDAELAYDSLQPSETFVVALADDCDDLGADCVRAPSTHDDQDLTMGPAPTNDGLVLQGDTCVAPTLTPCSTLSLFDGRTSMSSHLLSFDDHPVAIDDINAPPGDPANVWIMGDWNGDGVDSPGYYAAGKFRYTNDPSTSSTTLWSTELDLGQVDRPLVAGRFHASYGNDCIGVIQEPNVEVFSLKYWCELSNATHTGAQWIGGVLPDAAFPTGVHEFVSGDWDDDGIDEIAIRKDHVISYTHVDPEVGGAMFNHAQQWGVPPDELPETGVFVSGDWNGDGIDGWGVLYDDGNFYYRNDLSWPGPGTYYLQQIDNLFPDRSVSSHRFALDDCRAQLSSHPDVEFEVDFGSGEVRPVDPVWNAAIDEHEFFLGQTLRFHGTEPGQSIRMQIVVDNGTSRRELRWRGPAEEIELELGDLPFGYFPEYQVKFELDSCLGGYDPGIYTLEPQVILQPPPPPDPADGCDPSIDLTL